MQTHLCYCCCCCSYNTKAVQSNLTFRRPWLFDMSSQWARLIQSPIFPMALDANNQLRSSPGLATVSAVAEQKLINHGHSPVQLICSHRSYSQQVLGTPSKELPIRK